MPNQLWLPDVVADAFRGVKGYRVEVMNGWNARGRTNFAPIGVMNHHTGGGGYDALLNFMAHGSSISPLCNIATSRPVNGVVRITIVEAGRANHAGSGFLPWTGNNNGNYRTIGIENQNDGRQPWPQQQVEGIHILSAALLNRLGVGVDRLVDHKTYAPGRKPDRHSVDINNTRREVARIMGGGTVVTLGSIGPGDNGPAVREWQGLLLKWNPRALPRYGADGDFGDETTDWTSRFMVSVGLISSPTKDPVVGSKTRAAMDKALGATTPSTSTPKPKEPQYKVAVLHGADSPIDEGMALVYGNKNDLKVLSWPAGGATFETAFLVGSVANKRAEIEAYIKSKGFTPNIIRLAGDNRHDTAAVVRNAMDRGVRNHPGVSY